MYDCAGTAKIQWCLKSLETEAMLMAQWVPVFAVET